MSIRSLIEINHDFTWRLDDPAFVAALQRYLASACRETASDLERFGVHVITSRHHSGRYYVDPRIDGFPVQTPLPGPGK
jgi:hypothetical protein